MNVIAFDINWVALVGSKLIIASDTNCSGILLQHTLISLLFTDYDFPIIKVPFLIFLLLFFVKLKAVLSIIKVVSTTYV